MEIQFWQRGDDKLIVATVKSILCQIEDAEGVGEISIGEALNYYAQTISGNNKSDFVVEAFKPLEKRLLESFSKDIISKAIDDDSPPQNV